MNRECVAVLDSGIGGISLLLDLTNSMPNLTYVYLGDNNNAPYGNKSERDLVDITLKNIDILRGYGASRIVFGCNTLSVCILNKIKKLTDIKLYGVFPPVESCVMTGKSTLLISTLATSLNYKQFGSFYSVGLKNLAKDIDDNAFSLSKIDIKKHFVGTILEYKMDFENVILGCTHFEFVKNKIIDHFHPKKIISGIYLTSKMIKKDIERQKMSDFTNRFSLSFVGDCAEYNREFYLKVASKK